MKKILLCWLLISSCFVSLAGTKIKGAFKVSDQREFHVYLKALLPGNSNEKPIQQELNVGNKKAFVMDVTIKKAGLYSLSIVMQHADGNKSNYNSVIYLVPGRRLDIEYQAKGVHGLMCNYGKMRNADNKALFEVNEKYNQHITWLYNNLSDLVALKEHLNVFYALADSVRMNKDLSPEVQKYLAFNAFDAYSSNMYRFAADYLRGKDEKAVPADFYVMPKDPKPYFNDQMLLLFYNGISNVGRYLEVATATPLYKSRKSIAEINAEIVELNKVVSNTEIRNGVIESLLLNFTSRYRVGGDFEADLKEYTNTVDLLTDPELRASLIQSFENLRFTLKGAVLPSVEFEDETGKAVGLDQFKGKYLFIDLWASWCVPCIKMTPLVQELEKQYEGKNIAFVAISIDANKESWLKKMKELNMHGNQFLDQTSAFTKQLNISGIPHYMIYDPESKLVVYKTPMPDNPKLKELIDQLPGL